tara:strand:- start:8085 stop:8822 length:738 start_codon:yes stop_codon:yes gene_type:complete
MIKGNVFGLIGKNIDYSFSKKYFRKKFELENLNYTYSNFDLNNLDSFASIFIKNEIAGLNVTTPYKSDIIKHLDEIDKTALIIGAVNTIKVECDKKIGYNTDYMGFEKSLVPLIERKKTEHALILGSGGASKAIKYVLKNLNINYSIVSRKKGKSEFIYENLNKDLINKYKLIINCSPVGTFPKINNYPNIPYEFLSKDHILYDLVYNPDESLFLKKGKQFGSLTKNGLEMLKIQANESWKIWNF